MMTIYMVQQSFSRPDWEEEWNVWYGGHLKVLMSVPGFRTGQRFKAIDGSPPRYMAVYTVDSPDVFESKIYKDSGGGGTSSQRFRPAYQVWLRNLFEGIDTAPAVGDGECLVCIDCNESRMDLPDLQLAMLKSIGLHRTTPYRAIGVARQDQAERLLGVDRLSVYLPLTTQLGPLY